MKMKSIILPLFILQAIINGVNLAVAISLKTDRHECRGGDFKSDTIRKNRDAAMEKLLESIKNSTHHGFHYAEVGDKPEEQVSASFLCTPTVLKAQCECAFNKTVEYLLSNCPKQNEGVAWDMNAFVTTMVRYSTGRKILSVLDDWAWYRFTYIPRVNAIALEKAMDHLAGKLKEEAAGGDGLRKYANGTEDYDGEENKLFVAVQCTPDLSKEDCIKCLSRATNEIRSCCTSKLLFDGRVASTNCNLRYDHVTFFDAPTSWTEESCD